MDRFNFDAIDQDAFLKHDLMLKRRKKILCVSEETTPTPKQLYGDQVLHRDKSTTAEETNAQKLPWLHSGDRTLGSSIFN